MFCAAKAGGRRPLDSFVTQRWRSSTLVTKRCRLRTTICMSSRRQLSGLHELGNRYQGVLLDQFGVLHDGQIAYDDAASAVKWLHEQDMKVLIVSNSSKRSTNALQRIQQFGFNTNWFIGAVTSGEVVQEPSDADFILSHGTEALGQQEGTEAQAMSIKAIKAVLQVCAQQARPPPMVVANPDVVTVSGSDLIPMPGTLAEYYAGLGGKILWMGKPDPVIYKVALQMLQLPKEKVIAIGDSLQHDIQGACNAGVDSIFISGGIHAKDIAATNGEVDEEKVLQLFQQHQVEPTYTMPALRI
ncbi:MAG: hypothetical protein FRX49_06217 [Trebouxia sp. A1-2]|nr:MAG: hypothetical protein FRX49_06217 [Trebouxia sp. A1-2]